LPVPFSANQNEAPALTVEIAGKMAPSDVEYDTDSISITSTVEADFDILYTIEDIMSEGMGQDDDGEPVMKYLVKWEDYPTEELELCLILFVSIADQLEQL
jgi:hypothetical protein